MISELFYSHSLNMKRSSSVYPSLLLAARNVPGVFEKRAQVSSKNRFLKHVQIIRFVLSTTLNRSDLSDSEHAQSDEKSVNQRFLVTFPEVTIFVADQKEWGLWGRE